MIAKNKWSCLLLILSLAGCVSPPKNHSMAPTARVIDGGRELQVSVAQGEIKTNINQSNVAAAAGGGLLMALIDAGIESNRAKVAEQAIKPLRDALIGYDFDTQAQELTKKALAQVDWFQPRDYGFVKEVTAAGRSASLDATSSSQMSFVDYEYGMSAAFDAVELNVRVSIARKTNGYLKSVARLSPNNLAYYQMHKVVIPLKKPSKIKDENIKRWAADNAALTKQAIESGLLYAQWMIERGLVLSEKDALAITKGRKIVVGNYSGSLIERKDKAILLWLPMPVDQWVLAAEPIG